MKDALIICGIALAVWALAFVVWLVAVLHNGRRLRGQGRGATEAQWRALEAYEEKARRRRGTRGDDDDTKPYPPGGPEAMA